MILKGEDGEEMSIVLLYGISIPKSPNLVLSFKLSTPKLRF